MKTIEKTATAAQLISMAIQATTVRRIEMIHRHAAKYCPAAVPEIKEAVFTKPQLRQHVWSWQTTKSPEDCVIDLFFDTKKETTKTLEEARKVCDRALRCSWGTSNGLDLHEAIGMIDGPNHEDAEESVREVFYGLLCECDVCSSGKYEPKTCDIYDATVSKTGGIRCPEHAEDEDD